MAWTSLVFYNLNEEVFKEKAREEHWWEKGAAIFNIVILVALPTICTISVETLANSIG